ncbi:MAG: hypothetical protein KC547_02325 [Anaerolineae bacterium]|nr:hypothetical protein [Anaerolineae bacterium]MCA9908214.1 hypothetical protein [Anaerolineae bacterium]
MTVLPRILTIDPTGVSARLVRAAIDLTDQVVVQTDIPHSAAALAELSVNPYHLVVCAVRLYEDDIDGYALAQQIIPHLPNTAVVLIGENSDPDAQFDGNAIMIKRPLDPQHFFKVFQCALEGRDIRTALSSAGEATQPTQDLGPIPALDLAAVDKIIDELLRDVAPLSLVLATREGEVLLERGTDSRLDREQLAQAVLPAAQATIQVGHLARGKPSALSFYDGDQYDIFVLSIGYHHVLCLVFDGKGGSKLFGAVRNYAQRAALDVIALMGEGAFSLNHTNSAGHKGRKKPSRQPQVMDMAQESPAAVMHTPETDAPAATDVPATPRLQLEPLDNFDPALLDQLDGLNSADADALFDLDTLGEIAKGRDRNGGALTYEEAQRLGIVQ